MFRLQRAASPWLPPGRTHEEASRVPYFYLTDLPIQVAAIVHPGAWWVVSIAKGTPQVCRASSPHDRGTDRHLLVVCLGNALVLVQALSNPER